MTTDNETIVRQIVAENQYLTVATSDGKRPWLAPVQFCVDDELRFYFVSLPSSRHAEHIAANPRVGLAIFDSHQPPFTGRGVQVDGTAAVWSREENPFATIAGLDMPADLQQVAPGYVAFRIEPDHFYLPRGFVEGIVRDERLEVPMQG